jgi:tRNA A-37 threonylcarbamoyl transferase component Bud32
VADWQSFSTDELRKHSVKSYRDAHGSRPDVLLIRIDGDEAVLKDYTYSDTWFQRFIAPLLVYRELRALRKLDGIEGVPKLYHVYNMRAFLVESIPGTPASQKQAGDLGGEFFERMVSLINRIHERGVAHCDLRSSGNILVTSDQEPWLVDFVASIHQGSRWNVVARWIFSQFVEADLSAELKLKNRIAPELLTENELDAMENPRSLVERLGRKIGKSVRYLTQNIFLKR